MPKIKKTRDFKKGDVIYIKATIQDRWGFGQYPTEPNFGFDVKIDENQQNVAIVLDDAEVFTEKN